ncbi:MAG: DUF1045 domain-containing protein [Alphaproteobacteria bacterium]|nr:DUF1045 domain-containing protein [Alphaproteobacteria bacterium]
MGPEGRVALYYAPADDDPLRAAAAAWLGRDPAGSMSARLPLDGLAEITADAARYGFHATLKPPMRLREGATWTALRAAATEVAAAVPAFPLPPLAVASLDGFLALRETAPSPALQALADAAVAWLDHLRAPPDPAELDRRRPLGRSAAERAGIARWGYPYVFATWFFHMTLSRRLSEAEHALWRPRAQAHFAAALALPRRMMDLCLFVQPAPGAPFVIAERLPLTG